MKLHKSEITIVQFKLIDPDLLRWLNLQLPIKCGVKVQTGPKLDIPYGAFDRHREQYLGTALLAFLREEQHSIGGTLLGLIDADCYAEGLNFIFGQASLKGHEAIVALPRLRQSFYNLPEDPGLFRERVLKEAMHELGHTWGLPHCPEPRCVMHFSNTLHDTDVKEARFCGRCGEPVDDSSGRQAKT